MKKRSEREFLSDEEAWKVIGKIRNLKVKMLVRYFVELGCRLKLFGDGDFCNVYSPKEGHNIMGDIAINSEIGSFKIQLTRNDWKGIRNYKIGLDIEREGFVKEVIERINKVS